MRVLSVLCVALVAVLSVAGRVMAQNSPYVVDSNSDALIRVDPATGDRTVISGCADATCTTLVGTGTGFSFPRGIVFEADGQILVCDGDLTDLTNLKTIFRIDPSTGDRTVVSSSLTGSERGTGPAFDTLFDVILAENGDIFAADTEIDTIFRVDPVSGDRTILASNLVGTGATLSFPGDMVLDADGNILVTEGTNSQVLRIDPANGNRTIVSSSSVGTGSINFSNLGGITLEDDGGILVVDQGAIAVIAVDPVTGDRSEISGPLVGDGPDLVDTFSIDIDSAGVIYVADGSLGLVRIDPQSGDRVIHSSSTIGSGIPITLLRDVRVEPPAAPVPVGSPLTVTLVVLLMLTTAGLALSRRRATVV